MSSRTWASYVHLVRTRFFLCQLSALGLAHFVSGLGLLIETARIEQHEALSTSWRRGVIVIWWLGAVAVAGLFASGVARAAPRRPAAYGRWMLAAMLSVALAASLVSLTLGFGVIVFLFGTIAVPPIAQSLAFWRHGLRALAVVSLAWLATALAWSVIMLVDFNQATTLDALLWISFIDVVTALGASAGFALLSARAQKPTRTV